MLEQQTPVEQKFLIPDGDEGIAATLNYMVRLTRQYRSHMGIRHAAEAAISGVPAKDWWGEVAAIQNFVKNNIRYTQDVFDVETIKDPVTLLQSPFGDCDDMALLTAALLNSINHPVRFVAVSTSTPDAYDHVFVETKIGHKWISVETTEPVGLGWMPQQLRSPLIRHV